MQAITQNKIKSGLDNFFHLENSQGLYVHGILNKENTELPGQNCFTLIRKLPNFHRHRQSLDIVAQIRIKHIHSFICSLAK
jgi:hypothetical protein